MKISTMSLRNKYISNPGTASFGCNCPNKKNGLLNGECLTPQLVYRATVANAVDEDMKKNIDLTDTTFKGRHSNHKQISTIRYTAIAHYRINTLRVRIKGEKRCNYQI